MILLFVFVGVPAGLCGACSLLMVGPSPGMFLPGLLGLGLSGLLFWAAFKSGRSNTP